MESYGLVLVNSSYNTTLWRERAIVAEETSAIGPRIRAARLERGMTLAALGGDDLSRSFLSLVERGRSRVSLRSLSIIAERLELPLSYFLGVRPEDTAVEQMLDRAETALHCRRPADCLRILGEQPIPDALRSRAALLRGTALVDFGHPTDAIEPLREGLELVEGETVASNELLLRYHLGRALYLTGQDDEALASLRRALDIAIDTGVNPGSIGDIAVYIGHILLLRPQGHPGNRRNRQI
jgi:transcriptional regulator with XRE-family HTH domain